MNPSVSEASTMRSPNSEFRESGPAPSSSPALPPGIVAQRLIAVPWRHAGLIALCAVVGGLASTMFWLRPAPAQLVAAKPRMQAIQDAPPTRSPAGPNLRLDLDPGAVAAAATAVRMAAAMRAPSAALQLNNAREFDEIDAVLREAPPAAGRFMHINPDRAQTAGEERPDAMLPGLVAGLLLGLLVAARRELGGDRMRSPREAEWALGAPVLGAIPTLSAKARNALLEPSPTRPDAA